MFEILSQYSDTANGEQIPPVVVLTFIGPEFKLWIAYSSLDSNGIYHYVSGKPLIVELKILILYTANDLYRRAIDFKFLGGLATPSNCERHVILGDNDSETEDFHVY
jgi:hypothetical protein